MLTERLSEYLDYLIDPCFQWVNRLFVLLFENNAHRTGHTRYFLPKVETKDYNLMINGQNFWSASNKNMRISYNAKKIKIGQGDNYTTCCLLDYPYFKENYKLAIDLSKQQALHADPKVIKDINFKGHLAQDPIENTTMFFIIEETKETILEFPQETTKALWIYFTLK